jgi:hypothetical protein
MRRQVDEIWTKVLTREKYVEWFAPACEGVDVGPDEIVVHTNLLRFAKSLATEEEILRMHVLLCQGGEIPPGLMLLRNIGAELPQSAPLKISITLPKGGGTDVSPDVIQRASRRHRHKSEEQQNRFRIIRQVARQVNDKNLTLIRYCGMLRDEKLDTPRRWQDNRCPKSYAEAYSDKKWRVRISREKNYYVSLPANWSRQ